MVNSSENSSAVTTIDTYDMCGSGKDDLIVGRRDGTVQVFSLPLADSEIDTEIREIFCDVVTQQCAHVWQKLNFISFQNYQESISSIQGGCVGATGYTECVVCTYTGRVFGLTTQCIKTSLSDNNAASSSLDTKARIDKLK